MSTTTTLAPDSFVSASAKLRAMVVTPTPPFDGTKTSAFPSGLLLIGPAGASTGKRFAHGFRKEWLDQKFARAGLHGPAHQGRIVLAGGGHHGHGGVVAANVLNHMDGLLDIVVQIHNEYLAAQPRDCGQIVPRRIGRELVNSGANCVPASAATSARRRVAFGTISATERAAGASESGILGIVEPVNR